MDICKGKEVKEVQAKVIDNIFNKIITDNFPNLGKYIAINIMRDVVKPKPDINFPNHIIKTVINQTNESVLKTIM
jgi:hypothetical protein